jgi:hypothetical protein
MQMVAALKTPKSDFRTLVGTPTEVRKQLNNTKADRVVALTMPRGEEATKALSEFLKLVGPLIQTLVERRREKTFETLVDALVPQVPVSPDLMKEAEMAGRARSAVLESGNWLTAAEVSKLAGFSDTNPSAQPNKWKRDGLIFAIRHNGIDYYPDYCLDPDLGFRPRKEVPQILGVLKERKDDWKVAFWFASMNSFLGGRRPQDVLATEPGHVLDAARDEIEGVLHG